MNDLRLVIFDVDGTLVDSQFAITAAMARAYAENNMPPPDRAAVMSVVGLSLDAAFQRLSPEQEDATRQALAQAYKQAFFEARQRGDQNVSQFYPGTREMLDELHHTPNTLMALATGKSRRGVDAMIQEHELHGYFVSLQTADGHPSKPHPSMLQSCLWDAGVDAQRAVMIGDTSFDIDMARAAGIRSIAVTWGYHAAETLGADRIMHSLDVLPTLLTDLLEEPQ